MQLMNDALQTELGLLHKLIVYMGNRSDIEAQEAFRRLRTCDDPLELAKSLSTQQSAFICPRYCCHLRRLGPCFEHQVLDC
jgi:hypothetical protein